MMKRLMTIGIAASAMVMGGASGAWAEGDGPSAESLLGATTVGVLPVLSSGVSRDASYQRMAAYMSMGATLEAGTRPLARGGDLVELDIDSGFAFAGASTEADVAILKYAFLAASLTAQANDPAEIRDTAGVLEAGRALLAPLSPETISAIDRFILTAKRGQIDASALSASLMAAEAGIASGPARAHGYFATGVWLGVSVLAAALDEADPGFIAVAEPLAVMLDEDALFGGSDRQLAAQLRRLASLLSQPRLDGEAFMSALNAALSIEPDEAD